MSEKGEYSVEIIARSGDRILSELTYPEQSYSDFVSTQAAIVLGLLGAGIDRADLKGDPVPDELKALMGKLVSGKKPQG